MKEIGGYFELENFSQHEYHESAIKLNCGRHCLTYLVEAYDIKKIYIPFFSCNSVQCFNRYFPNVEICFYKINEDSLLLNDFSKDFQDSNLFNYSIVNHSLPLRPPSLLHS